MLTEGPRGPPSWIPIHFIGESSKFDVEFDVPTYTPYFSNDHAAAAACAFQVNVIVPSPGGNTIAGVIAQLLGVKGAPCQDLEIIETGLTGVPPELLT